MPHHAKAILSDTNFPEEPNKMGCRAARKNVNGED